MELQKLADDGKSVDVIYLDFRKASENLLMKSYLKN